jgi:hypothetical protein
MPTIIFLLVLKVFRKRKNAHRYFSRIYARATQCGNQLTLILSKTQCLIIAQNRSLESTGTLMPV